MSIRPRWWQPSESFNKYSSMYLMSQSIFCGLSGSSGRPISSTVAGQRHAAGVYPRFGRASCSRIPFRCMFVNNPLDSLWLLTSAILAGYLDDQTTGHCRSIFIGHEQCKSSTGGVAMMMLMLMMKSTFVIPSNLATGH